MEDHSMHHEIHPDATRMVGAGGTAPEGARKFLPLILVLGAILALTFIADAARGDVTLRASMQLFMGFFFLVFGAFKMFDWRGFAGAYAEYDILAKRSVVYAYAYPIIELFLAACFLFDISVPFASGITVLIMAVGSAGVLRALLDTRRIPCACLGVVVKLPMTTVTLLEDIGMGIMALLMIFWQ